MQCFYSHSLVFWSRNKSPQTDKAPKSLKITRIFQKQAIKQIKQIQRKSMLFLNFAVFQRQSTIFSHFPTTFAQNLCQGIFEPSQRILFHYSGHQLFRPLNKYYESYTRLLPFTQRHSSIEKPEIIAPVNLEKHYNGSTL